MVYGEHTVDKLLRHIPKEHNPADPYMALVQEHVLCTAFTLSGIQCHRQADNTCTLLHRIGGTCIMCRSEARGLIEGMVGGWWLLDGMFHQQLATQNATFEETHKKSHRLRLDRMACFCLKLENCPFLPIQNSTPPHPPTRWLILDRIGSETDTERR